MSHCCRPELAGDKEGDPRTPHSLRRERAVLKRHVTHPGTTVSTVERFWRLVGEFPAELRMGPRGEGG